MPPKSPNSVAVAEHVILDGRLALFHETQRWLAVADLHFGYEWSQRAAGRLMPLWDMDSIEQRLAELIRDYKPRHLIVVKDLVHDRASAPEGMRLIDRLRDLCQPIIVAFVQEGSCWILPAFSVWAAGADWPRAAESSIWLCAPQRILRLSQSTARAAPALAADG